MPALQVASPRSPQCLPRVLYCDSFNKCFVPSNSVWEFYYLNVLNHLFERQRSLIHWGVPRMSGTVDARPLWDQELRIKSRSQSGGVRAQALSHPLLPPRGCSSRKLNARVGLDAHLGPPAQGGWPRQSLNHCEACLPCGHFDFLLCVSVTFARRHN